MRAYQEKRMKIAYKLEKLSQNLNIINYNIKNGTSKLGKRY